MKTKNVFCQTRSYFIILNLQMLLKHYVHTIYIYILLVPCNPHENTHTFKSQQLAIRNDDGMWFEDIRS